MVSKKGNILMTFRCFIIALILGVVTIGGLPGESIGASEEEGIAKIIEGARQEGEMTVYSSTSIDTMTTVAKKFEGKYPFIKVGFYRSGTPTVLRRVITEARAKRYTPDVIIIPGFQAYMIKKEGLYAKYVSPEYKFYQKGLKDPEGYWTSFYIQPLLMGYNTKLLLRKDIPDTYEGFLQPKWKGKKIGFDTNEVEGFANMLKIMGEKKGMDFFRKLVAQQLAYRKGRSLIADLVIAGEFPVGTVYIGGVELRKNKGAKIDWVGVSPVIAKFHTIGVAAHAPHPNAAKLFTYYCQSREGQALIGSLENVPARSDVDVDILKAFKGIKLYPSDISLAENLNTYSNRFAELLRTE